MPTTAMVAAQARAPAVRTRPWTAYGWRGLGPVVAGLATSERAGAGEWWIVTVVTPVGFW
jgi:hypothetical protein